MKINPKSSAQAICICLCLAAGSISAYGKSITTADLIARSHSLSCLDWKISGICIWLKCSIFGCYIVTTPRISHRLPDVVFQVYPNAFEPPWQSGLNYRVFNNRNNVSGGIFSGVTRSNRQSDSLQFNEVDAIGSPAIGRLNFGRFLCKSAAKAFFPYFISVEDHISWRGAGADANKMESVTPGIREIGQWPHFTWGSVYPRIGFLIQSDPAKSAAVSAQRAADLIFRDPSEHIVRPLSRTLSNRVIRGNPKARNESECSLSGGSWASDSRGDTGPICRPQTWEQWLPRSNEKKDKWQMILPKPVNSCETFGRQRDFDAKKMAADRQYIWNYWGNYKCCVHPGGKLIKAFDF